MGELQIQHPFSLPPPPLPPLPPPSSSRDETAPPPSSSQEEPPPSPPPPPPPSLLFDPSRMIGIIKRKALIKDLAAVYHAECLAYCQELLELQTKIDEPFIDVKPPEEPRKEMLRPRATKRLKKSR